MGRTSACTPLVSGRRRRASSCCTDGKSEARSGHRPGRAHAASGPQSWASNRAVLINMTLYQPGERIRASPLCLSKTQLDAEATLVSAPGPPVTGLSGASRLWVPSNRLLRPAPSPALLPEAAVSVDCVKALTGRLEDAAGLAGRSRRGAGAFLGSGRRKGRTGFPSGLGLWGRRSPVSNTCSVTVTAQAQELPSEQHGQDAAPPGARVLAEGRTRRDAPALRKPRKEEENVKAPAIARPSVSCPSSRDQREAGGGGAERPSGGVAASASPVQGTSSSRTSRSTHRCETRSARPRLPRAVSWAEPAGAARPTLRG